MTKFAIIAILVLVLIASIPSVVSAQAPVYNPPVYTNPYGYSPQGLSYEVKHSWQKTQYDFNYAKNYVGYGQQKVTNYYNSYRQTGALGASAHPYYPYQ